MCERGGCPDHIPQGWECMPLEKDRGVVVVKEDSMCFEHAQVEEKKYR